MSTILKHSLNVGVRLGDVVLFWSWFWLCRRTWWRRWRTVRLVRLRQPGGNSWTTGWSQVSLCVFFSSSWLMCPPCYLQLLYSCCVCRGRCRACWLYGGGGSGLQVSGEEQEEETGHDWGQKDCWFVFHPSFCPAAPHEHVLMSFPQDKLYICTRLWLPILTIIYILYYSETSSGQIDILCFEEEQVSVPRESSISWLQFLKSVR